MPVLKSETPWLNMTRLIFLYELVIVKTFPRYYSHFCVNSHVACSSRYILDKLCFCDVQISFQHILYSAAGVYDCVPTHLSSDTNKSAHQLTLHAPFTDPPTNIHHR